MDEAFRCLGLGRFAPRLRVVAGLGERTGILDHVVGGLHPDVTIGIESGTSRPTRQLMELADGEHPHARSVELGEGSHQHRADGDVHADAECVGSADHREEPGTGEPFDEPPVAGEHPGMVDADSVADQPVEREAEAPPHLLAGHRCDDRFPL